MTRLSLPFGSDLDRTRPLTFSFEGRKFVGLAGDSIASALAANDQWVLSRSFKYHRPRSVLAYGMNEAAALVQLPGEPNVAADTRPLESGMDVFAQNVRGSLRRDRAAIIGRLAAFLPVGFYYRTFFRPGHRAWLNLWEPMIRRASGLGKVDRDTKGAAFEKRHLTADVVVVGGGPAGIAAALEAARQGAEVLLLDENPALGGTLQTDRSTPEDVAALDDLRRAVAEERRIAVLLHARCTGWFPENDLVVAAGGDLLKVRARRVVLATGSYEQPLIFAGNDLPGIMFASTAQRLIHRYAVRPGERAVVVTSGDRGYRAAADLRAAGVELAAILDLRSCDVPQAWQGVAIADVRIRGAEGAKRRWHVTHVAFARGDRGTIERLACDLVCLAVGDLPAFHLPLQTGAQLTIDSAARTAQIEGLRDGVHLAGAVAGAEEDLAAVLASGRLAGAAAAGVPDAERRSRHPGSRLAPVPTGGPEIDVAGFVDLDEDVQVKDIRHALADGYRHVELVKRFTTAGMGTSQGRFAGLPIAALVASEIGAAPGAIRITTVRPPAGPEELGRLAGPPFAPLARTPMHDDHVAAGAVMQGVGGWLRPAFYRGDGDRVAGEVSLVRGAVGMLDVSTLGKIELRGADAGLFLDRLYTLRHSTQRIGMVRYGLMLNEMGSVMDDGVVARLEEDFFYITTTTSGVGHVLRWMLKWQARWGLAVDFLNITSARGAINVAGPRARDVLVGLSDDIDFGAEAFPWLAIRTGHLASVPIRAMRIGFAGELAYELHAPRSLAAHLWRAILSTGVAKGLRPYGVEASRILRLEKGHIIVGQDTDAMSTPAELGFDWAVSRHKRFFVGKRSLELTIRKAPMRRLVGFTARFVPAGGRIDEGLIVVDCGAPAGWVTSAAFSPTLGHWIGLAMLPASLVERREQFPIRLADGRSVEATRVALPFFDPDNVRQDA